MSTERVPLSYEHCALFINISELIAREIERDALEAEDASVHSLPSAHARCHFVARRCRPDLVCVVID